ncbi:MAG: guanylate kinase [Fidelibacterota bacterium]
MKNLIIISAPSGSGKTTVCKALMKRNPDIHFSVSCTTRPQRLNEVDGVDYYFMSDQEFEARIQRNEFAEWEQIHGNFYYGTLKKTLEDAIEAETFLLLELDVQGAMSLKELYPENNLSIFIMPPSLDDLKVRLRKRGTDSEDRIKKRLERLNHELDFKKYFDHDVINDNLDMAVTKIVEIINLENEGILYGT